MQKTKSKKSRRVYWISTIILIAIATVGWMRFQQALRHWYYLIDLGVWPPPLYFAVSGGLIGILYSLGLVFHIAGQAITPLYVKIITGLLILWLWADRIFFTNQDYFNQLLAGTIFFTVCLLVIGLLLFRKKFYSHKAGGNEPEN